MRIGLISDLHSNIHALRAVLNDLTAHDPDIVLCAGDLVGYGAFPGEVIEAVGEAGITSVAGNYDEAVGHDRPMCGCDFTTERARLLGEESLRWTQRTLSKEQKAFLVDLPGKRRFSLGPIELLLVHGSPRSSSEYVRGDSIGAMEEISRECSAHIVAFGHTHIPFQKAVGGVHFLNVGSVGRPKDGDPRACYCLLEIGTGFRASFHRVDYPIEEAAGAIDSSGLPREFADDLRRGRTV